MFIQWKILIRQLAWSAIVLIAVTLVCIRVFPVNATTAGLVYLIAILGIASASGLATAVASSLAAMLCFNYFFLPPVGQFTIADPQNWIALAAFLIAALVASRLSSHARSQAREARRRVEESEHLYAFSRAILLAGPDQPLGSHAAQQIAELFNCRAVALFDAKTGETFRGGVEDLPAEDKLKEAVERGVRIGNGQVIVAPVILGGPPIGSLALKGPPFSEDALRAVLNLVAIAFERVRAQEAASAVQAARQSEELKSTLLDAIAHEFKTPLTSIKAASTSMLSNGSLAPQIRELGTIIDEEADRMNSLVTEAVRMSQIEAGKMRLERTAVDVGALLSDVVAQFGPRAEGRELSLTVSPGLPQISADSELVSLAIRQLIDNALKYSPPASPVRVRIDSGPDGVYVHVHDDGPGIPPRDRERVFQKFYRRAVKANVPGSGLGLFIARAIVRTHGGDVWIEETGGGCEFCMSLPLQKEIAEKRGQTTLSPDANR